MPDISQRIPDPPASSLTSGPVQEGGNEESTKTESQPVGKKAEMTKTDGTKKQITISQNPEKKSGLGVRGNELNVDALMRSSAGSNKGFSAQFPKGPSLESKFAQDKLGIGARDELSKAEYLTQEGDAKEILMEDTPEMLKEDAKEKLMKSAEEILDDRGKSH